MHCFVLYYISLHCILSVVSNCIVFCVLNLSDNALGHGGKLAQVYGNLVKDMWCDSYTKVVPRELKRAIGEFQPQFAGYEQQDSQELMGFLLDGLHEDLNRAKKKPCVTKIESRYHFVVIEYVTKLYNVI